MDRVAIADFLRRHRHALQPDDVGLPRRRRRRTAGLRREEVAALANISTDFYARLEQGRGARPSEQTAVAFPRKITTCIHGVTWRICARFIAGALHMARHERWLTSYTAAVVNSLSSGISTKSRSSRIGRSAFAIPRWARSHSTVRYSRFRIAPKCS